MPSTSQPLQLLVRVLIQAGSAVTQGVGPRLRITSFVVLFVQLTRYRRIFLLQNVSVLNQRTRIIPGLPYKSYDAHYFFQFDNIFRIYIPDTTSVSSMSSVFIPTSRLIVIKPLYFYSPAHREGHLRVGSSSP